MKVKIAYLTSSCNELQRSGVDGREVATLVLCVQKCVSHDDVTHCKQAGTAAKFVFNNLGRAVLSVSGLKTLSQMLIACMDFASCIAV